MILANIHPYRIVLILILSYPRILCFDINRGSKGEGLGLWVNFLFHLAEKKNVEPCRRGTRKSDAICYGTSKIVCRGVSGGEIAGIAWFSK